MFCDFQIAGLLFSTPVLAFLCNFFFFVKKVTLFTEIEIVHFLDHIA